tara:strand:- start:3347 stop:3550 length:204 start_codon:yes stop_codon:yes gene_type:complete
MTEAQFACQVAEILAGMGRDDLDDNGVVLPFRGLSRPAVQIVDNLVTVVVQDNGGQPQTFQLHAKKL